MTESVINSKISLIREKSRISQLIMWLVWEMVIATVILMAIGSATRVMNAGLACPDWPLCYGQLIPTQQMNLQVFLEWFHRLDAALIGCSAIALVILSWWYRQNLPQWLFKASIFALFLILFQGVLGGLTVTELLRFDIVTAHLGTAMLFLVTLVAIASCLTPYQGTGISLKLPIIGSLAAILVYIQSISGGLVASRWALHQCFSLEQLCSVMNSHIFGVIPPTLTTLILVIVAWKTPALTFMLRNLTNIAAFLVILQIILGIATFKLHLQVEPLTVSHETVAATLLATLVTFSVFAIRDHFELKLNS